ncbi:MAG: hypothetical protein SV422_02675 [Pseudomonadota bacterium]|nr:hypothetical protein [Pseudomonadota bacterium]
MTITFEEMEFEHPDDFQTTESRSGPAIVTKFGEFNFEYDPARPVSAIVDSLLDDYHQRFPGKYRVVEETLEIDERSSTIFHIVPGASKDISGAYVPRHSLLDVPVSVHFDHPAHVDTILCAVLEQASKLQDTPLLCLTDFAHFFLGLVLYEYHAENVPARTLLLRLLNETGHHLSWNVNRASTKRDYAVVFYSAANGL